MGRLLTPFSTVAKQSYRMQRFLTLFSSLVFTSSWQLECLKFRTGSINLPNSFLKNLGSNKHSISCQFNNRLNMALLEKFDRAGPRTRLKLTRVLHRVLTTSARAS